MDRNKSKYAEIVRTLQEEMRDGRYRSSSEFPSVCALMRRFGVARATVARAVSVLRQLGLVRSRVGARTVVTRKGRSVSGSLGLIVHCYAEMFPPICRRLLTLAQLNGFLLMVGDTSGGDPNTRPADARRLAADFVHNRVAGVMYQPLAFHRDADVANRDILGIFRAANIPVVLFESAPTTDSDECDYDMVGIDNFAAGERMAAHLVEAGARQIVFAVGRYPTEGNVRRLEGARFRAAKSDVGFSTHFGSAAALVRKIRQRASKRGRTAILASSDHYAAEVLTALSSHGVKVPEDMMLAGFDDVNDARMCVPQLTTVRMPCEDIATEAFRCLQERISDSKVSPRRIMLPAPLVIRESTGPVPSRKGSKT